MNLARSPNTKKTFRDFEFKSVYSEGKKGPDDPALWKQGFQRMGIAGARHGDAQIDLKNLSTCIDQAIASRGTVAVFAEVTGTKLHAQARMDEEGDEEYRT